jgi:HSP20 family protein
MPAIIRKNYPTVLEARREILHAIHWQVRSNAWRPPTDAFETEEAFVVKVEIAGMRDEDFTVSTENYVLRIEGVRPDLGGRRAYHQMEILSGRFEIEVEISIPVDMDSALAEYRDGFLTITLPKVQSNQVRVDE